MEQVSELSEKIADILASLAHQKLAIEKNPASEVNSINGSVSNESATNRKVKSNVERRRLPLLLFSGDPMEWQPFWDSFASIHNDEELSKYHKFQYLMKSLRENSKAHNTIRGLQICERNYDNAIKMLQDRFGRTQKVVFAYLNDFMNTSPATDNSRGLRQLFDKCERLIHGLNAAGLKPEQYDTFLPCVLLNKLPQEIAIKLGERNGDNDWELSTVIQYFSEILSKRIR